MYKTIFYCVALLALSNLYPATPPAETAGVAELVITAFYQAYPDKISAIIDPSPPAIRPYSQPKNILAIDITLSPK